MSSTVSIANFYVDSEGKERPIKYKAADLVNKLAPNGYHWEKRNPVDEWHTGGPGVRISRAFDSDKYDAGFYDFYICVKDSE